MSRRGHIEHVPVGLMLAPDVVFLDLLHDVIRTDIDYCEVTPETLWLETREGALAPNGFHREFLELKNSHGLPFVAHSVGASLGSLPQGDAPFRERWHEQMLRDQGQFGFHWITDHLGASSLAGQKVALPLPTPMTATYAAITRTNLYGLQRVNPHVGVENSVFYYLHGEPLAEPAFLRQILSAPGFHLLLDLHNVYTMSKNFGFDPMDYLNRLPLERVIEIHIAGGQQSDPNWLPSGGTMRLDSHDHMVPESVWSLLESVAPECPNLRGVTLERMEGTVTSQDVSPIREELRRAKRIVQTRDTPVSIAVPASIDSSPTQDTALPNAEAIRQVRHFEELVANAMRSANPIADFASAAVSETLSDELREAAGVAHDDGIRLSALLVAKLRFERLIQSSPEAAQWYDEDAGSFTSAFRDYHREVFPSPAMGQREAEDFSAWRARRSDA